MKSLSLNKNIFFSFILFLFFTPLSSEDSVDIWNKENLNKKATITKQDIVSSKKKKSNIDINKESLKVIDARELNEGKNLIYGIFDPDENNLTLDMWLNSEGTRVKDTIDRINKIELSSYAEEIFVNTLYTVSNLPGVNMTETEFINYKLDWLINNEKDELISIFLNKNKKFPNKKKIIKYLVDKNIAKANIVNACEKIDLINKDVKDSYLDQFKIICLIKRNKKNEAQLVHDLLKEQKLSNKFFDSNVNYLLGLSNKENKKINDSTLLNFYISSISVSDFNYTPDKNTNKKIWQYLNAAKLIKIDNFEDNNRIKELEIAANENYLAKSNIFEIYKNIKFNINDFLNVEDVYQKLEPSSSRALVYQKILLSDNIEAKLKYLFLLSNLFEEDNLSNVYKEYLSQELKSLDSEKIPLEYKQLVAANIINKEKNILGKISYNDNNYHSSKIIKLYTEQNISSKKTQKNLERIHKKIKKNKSYKISLKDAALFESLENDNFTLPKGLNYQEIARNNPPPMELLNLVKNKEIGLFLLRIVEIIGEDEILDLDDQTIYFINHLFVKSNLIKLRNKILFTTLPERNEI